MSMTKKEKAAMDEAIKRAELLAALRWTYPVAKDIPAPSYSWKPSDGREFTEGWDFNSHSKTVGEWWSETTAHGSGKHPGNERYRSASQNSKSLFSTKILALKALRHAVEKQAAEDLLKIDRLIENEKDSQP